MPKSTISLDVKKASPADLVKFYNENSGSSKPITKFKDRATAEKRVNELIKAHNELAGGNSKTPAKTPKASKATATGAVKEKGERGRKSDGAGKTIHKLVKDNPRREGTRAWKVWELITPGMKYEDYMSKGGDNRDLMHEVKRGRVELK